MSKRNLLFWLNKMHHLKTKIREMSLVYCKDALILIGVTDAAFEYAHC